MTSPNEQQIEYWNEQAGPRWVTMQEVLDRQIEHFGYAVMDAAAIAPGQSVLDIGCGCGATTVEIGRRVTKRGAVLGVDISRPMLNRAEERARVGQMKHVIFAQSDAQTHAFDPETYDVVFSRFGVMFFENPTAAFTNIRKALKPGGKLAFVCWNELKQNAWMLEPIMAIADPVELPPPPDPTEPGPFALADTERLKKILSDAGYKDIAIDPFTKPIVMGKGLDMEGMVDFYFQIGPLSRILADATEDQKQTARERLTQLLNTRTTPEGATFGSFAWLVSANN